MSKPEHPFNDEPELLEDVRAITWDPILLLPAARMSGGILLQSWRDPLAGLALARDRVPLDAGFLLIPAFIAYWVHLPVVHPRPNEGALTMDGAAAILFTKQLLFSGLLDELGWRGWLLPRLQQRYSPLVASVLVWFPWALWHAPRISPAVWEKPGSATCKSAWYSSSRSQFCSPGLQHSGGSIVVVAIFTSASTRFYSSCFALLRSWH